MLSNTTTIYSHTRDKVQLDTYSLKTTPLSDLTRTLLLSSNWDFIHCFKYALIKQYFAQTTIILLLVCRLRLVVVHHHLVVNIIRHAHAPKTLSLCKYSSTHHLKLNLTSQHIIGSIAGGDLGSCSIFDSYFIGRTLPPSICIANECIDFIVWKDIFQIFNRYAILRCTMYWYIAHMCMLHIITPDFSFSFQIIWHWRKLHPV